MLQTELNAVDIRSCIEAFVFARGGREGGGWGSSGSKTLHGKTLYSCWLLLRHLARGGQRVVLQTFTQLQTRVFTGVDVINVTITMDEFKFESFLIN